MEARVLVVDNYDSFTYNLTQIIEECGWAPSVVKNDRLDVDEVIRYEKILISPGPGLPSEAGGTCDLIRRFAGMKSILGICLGHQAISEVFGGKLVQLPISSHGVSRRIRITSESIYLFGGMPKEIVGGLYHSWGVSVESLPLCLNVTAVSDDGTIMALSHREFDVHGIQFHPESILTPQGRAIIRNWLDHS